MVTGDNNRVALLSIWPEYANAILSGHKKIEFRKRRFAPDISQVLLYSTAPQSEVVGVFHIAGYDQDEPAILWERHQDHSGVEKHWLLKYYGDNNRAVGIQIGHTCQFKDPIPLSAIIPHSAPPQGFRYLNLNYEFWAESGASAPSLCIANLFPVGDCPLL